MYHLKLIKLLYLAERDSLAKYGEPINDDNLVSMDHGPVLSNTLNLINGSYNRDTPIWDDWISDREDHQISLKVTSLNRDDFDELSDSEIQILDDIWNIFGEMDRWALCDYTHENCTEWKNPHGSSIPISHRDVFLALGKNNEEATQLSGEILEHRKLDSFLVAL